MQWRKFVEAGIIWRKYQKMLQWGNKQGFTSRIVRGENLRKILKIRVWKRQYDSLKNTRERERESVYEEISNVPGTLENSLST